MEEREQMATEYQWTRGAKDKIEKQDSSYCAVANKAKSDLTKAHCQLAEQANQFDLIKDEVTNYATYVDELRTEHDAPIVALTASLHQATEKATNLSVQNRDLTQPLRRQRNEPLQLKKAKEALKTTFVAYCVPIQSKANRRRTRLHAHQQHLTELKASGALVDDLDYDSPADETLPKEHVAIKEADCFADKLLTNDKDSDSDNSEVGYDFDDDLLPPPPTLHSQRTRCIHRLCLQPSSHRPSHLRRPDPLK